MTRQPDTTLNPFGCLLWVILIIVIIKACQGTL